MMDAPADLIVIGTIYTAEESTSAARAFAVRGGRFVYVGSEGGALALSGPETTLLRFEAGCVLPGFVDSHLHLTNLGLTLAQVDLACVASAEQLVERVAAFASNAQSEWIVGRGWDENRWSQRRFPSHAELSAAIPDRPVALGRVDGHALLANARAMGLCGIDGSTPDPPGGRIVRDERGEPTGLFIDAAQSLIYARVPPPRHAELVAAARAAIAECNRWGVTAVAEPGCDAAVLAAQTDVLCDGGYTLRNHAMLHDEPALLEAHFRIGPIGAAYDGRLSVRAIKMYADGALGSRGAALLAPYSDDPANRGLTVTAPQQIEAVAERAIRNGFQPCVHAIGDRANRDVLDAYERIARRLGGIADARPRIEHAQVVAGNDIPRFARLGVIAAVQAPHALSDLEWAVERLGPERIDSAYAWRRLIDAGVPIANGTDAPVESASSARTFYASITGGGLFGERCMTRAQALSSMTTWAANANFGEASIGSIARGKYADFVVLNRDWMSVAPPEILETEIIATYFSGKAVATSKSS